MILIPLLNKPTARFELQPMDFEEVINFLRQEISMVTTNQTLMMMAVMSTSSRRKLRANRKKPQDDAATVGTVPEDASSIMDENDSLSFRKTNQAETVEEASTTQNPHSSSTRSIQKKKPFERYLRFLAKQESIFGRYHTSTALAYASLGRACRKHEDPRAIVMFRAQYRIQMVQYGKMNGRIAGPLKEILEKKGLNSSDMTALQEEIIKSTKHEVEGDLLRQEGERIDAIQEYQKAARVEELCFGRDNPDLAFLCRKIACLAAIRKQCWTTSSHTINFNECDKMGSTWLREYKELLLSTACSRIRRGDVYYSTMLYGEAIYEYCRASAFLRIQVAKKNKAKQQKEEKHASEQEARRDVSEELAMLLAGALRAVSPGNSPEKSNNNTVSENARKNSIVNRDMRTVQSVSSQPFEMSQMSLDITSAGDGEASLTDQSHDIPRSSKAATKDTVDGTTTLVQAKSNREGSIQGTMVTHHDEASLASALSENSRPEPGKKKALGKTRRKPKSTRSEKSFLKSSTRTMDSTELPPKPKSDSYLSKIATKTRKVASKTTKIAKRQLKRGANTVLDLGSGLQDTKGTSRQTLVKEKTKKSDSRSTSKTKALSEKQVRSYGAMSSPPPTPFHPKVTADTLGKVRPLDAFALMDDGVEKANEIEAPEQDHSIAGSSFLPTEAKGVQNEDYTCVVDADLVQFLSRSANESGDETMPTDNRSNADNQSVMTSDEDMLERFKLANEKAKVGIQQTLSNTSEDFENSTTTTPNTSNTTKAPSQALMHLLGSIQTMFSVLQRQAVRLQNQLADAPKPAPDKRLKKKHYRKQHPRFLPKDSRALYSEIQRLFEECESTLDEAFSQMDRSSFKKNKPQGNEAAMAEFRRTFALERVFLKELRRKVQSTIETSGDADSSYGSSIPSTPDSQRDGIEVRASFRSPAEEVSASQDESGEPNVLSVVIEN